MSEYTKLEDAIRDIETLRGIIKSIVQSLPTIEGSVVRCKDCMHWNSETKGCKRSPSVEAWHENDYCSYGERWTE